MLPTNDRNPERDLISVTPSGDQLDWPSWRSGQLLTIAGLAHVFVFMADQGSWEGSVSWRKPILFGVSTGMTLTSVTWVVSLLNTSRFDHVLLRLLSVSLLVEVTLITVQQWRGVPSHFNRETGIDLAIDNVMLMMIIFAFLIICFFTVRSFAGLQAAKDIKVGIRSGMTFLVLSCVVGFAISVYGYMQVAKGGDPSLLKPQGVAKFPHGIAIHALQLFPLMSWVMTELRIPVSQRCQLIWRSAIAFAMFFLYAGIQTLLGRSRTDFTVLTGSFLLIGLMLGASVLLPLVSKVLVRRQNQSWAASDRA